MIVERAEMGDHDYVTHGADLFVDLFSLVVRIIAILTRREGDENDRSRSRSRRR